MRKREGREGKEGKTRNGRGGKERERKGRRGEEKLNQGTQPSHWPGAHKPQGCHCTGVGAVSSGTETALTASVNQPPAGAAQWVPLLHNGHQVPFQKVDITLLGCVALALGLVKLFQCVGGQELGAVPVCLTGRFRLKKEGDT